MADRWVAPASLSAKVALTRCLEENADALLSSIRVYVQRFGLAQGSEAASVARDVLQEVSVQALEHADAFDVARRPLPWLLGVALNIIRRMRVEQARRTRREQPASAFAGAAEASPTEEPLSEVDLWDRISGAPPGDPYAAIEATENAEAILALVPPADRETLRLALIEDWDRESLAQRLGVTPGAARTRLHRALTRLRAAWFAQDANDATSPAEGAPHAR